MNQIQFDVTISNPPYSLDSHNTGSSAYEDFVEKQYQLTKDKGELICPNCGTSIHKKVKQWVGDGTLNSFFDI